MPKEIVTTLAGLAAYVAIALGYSTIYQPPSSSGSGGRCGILDIPISPCSKR